MYFKILRNLLYCKEQCEVLEISELRPDYSFKLIKTQYAAHTSVWARHACHVCLKNNLPDNVGSTEGPLNQKGHGGLPLMVAVCFEAARVLETIVTIEELSRPDRNDVSLEVEVWIKLEEIQEEIGQTIIVPFSLVRPWRSLIIGKSTVLIKKELSLTRSTILYLINNTWIESN